MSEPTQLTVSGLDRFTARVLRLIAEDSPVGFVRLSTQVWPIQVPGDWWLLLEEVVKDLCERGLVTYRLGQYYGGAGSTRYFPNSYIPPSQEEILEVRITPSGLLKAGFPVRRVDTQRRNLMHVAHDYIPPAKNAVWVDWTRYWHHPFRTTGGPIEKEFLRLHRIMYPAHRHGDDWAEGETVMTISTQEPAKQRRGVPVEPAKIEEARRLLGEGKSYKEAAAAVGISPFTLYGIIPAGKESSKRAAATRAERKAAKNATPEGSTSAKEPVPAHETDLVLVPPESVAGMSPKVEDQFIAGSIAAESLKKRMLKAIAETGPYKSTDELMAVVRRPGDNFGTHEFYHLLHSLSKGGMVTFVLQRPAGSRRANSNKSAATNIRATNSGYRAAGYGPTMDMTVKGGAHPTTKKSDGTDPRNQPDIAPGGPIERSIVLHLHEHDLAMWQARCQACMVYHPTGQTHAASIRPKDEPVAAPFPWETVVGPPDNTESLREDLAVEVPANADTAVRDHEPTFAEQAGVKEYPALNALRERQAQRLELAAKAAKYLEAAALLEDIDPTRSKELMAQAEEADGEPFTATEAEYLAFAHDRGYW